MDFYKGKTTHPTEREVQVQLRRCRSGARSESLITTVYTTASVDAIRVALEHGLDLRGLSRLAEDTLAGDGAYRLSRSSINVVTHFGAVVTYV